MKGQKVKFALTALSAFSLLAACKRDIVAPNDNSSTAQRAVTPKAANSPGNPFHFPVFTDSSFTVAGGPGSTLFGQPVSVASAGTGFVWVSDIQKNQIYLVSTINGIVFVTVGNGSAGFQDGTLNTASFNHPNGIATGPDGIVYVADMDNNRIRMINFANGTVSTLAGSGVAGFADGTPAVAKFNKPSGVAVDANGTVVYVADQGNNMIRRIINKTSVTRWAGQLAPGAQDGIGSVASFNAPRGIAVAPNGTVYVADMGNNKIRKINSGNVVTFAGSGIGTLTDGTGTLAAFNLPSALALDSAANLYVTDQSNTSIRLVTPAGVVTTLAGSRVKGSSDGYGSNVKFLSPNGIVVDPTGDIFITDQLIPALKKLLFTPAVLTLAGNGQAGYQEGKGPDAIFSRPSSVAVAPDGTIYAFDDAPTFMTGTKIRKITPDGTTSLVAGGTGSSFQDGPVAQAQFNRSLYLAVAPDGTLYVADRLNNRVRKVAGGMVTTVAGNGEARDVDGVGTHASIHQPGAIAIDAAGMIYVGTFDGNIRKITPAGVVTTVNQMPRVPVLNNGIADIRGLAIDAQGHKFVSSLYTLYEFTSDNTAATLIYGGVKTPTQPLVAGFSPEGIVSDAAGNVYIGGFQSERIYKISPSRVLTTLSGNGVIGSLDGTNAAATFSDNISGLALSPTGIIYIADLSNNKIRMMSRQ